MTVRSTRDRQIGLSILLAGAVGLANSAAALLPFPYSANQRGTVSCLEKPSISYDVYLPPAYATTNPPLPILYTFHPNGGGMVGYFQAVCSAMNIIVVGVTGSANGVSYDIVFKEFFAVTRDIRQRVLFDPTAVFASGFSGGGEACYGFARFAAQHVAGIMPIAGWLGRQGGNYYSVDRVQTNLLNARITGDSDWSAIALLAPDSNYLATCGVIMKDWYYSGDHEIAFPDSIKTEALTWLLSQRVPAGPDDQTNAATQAIQWRSRAASGQKESVVRECMAALMEHPRSWIALQAQLVMDDLMQPYGTFRPVPVANVAQGDFAYDLFYYYGRAAANGGDIGRYRSAMKMLTGVTGSSGDRAGDIRALLLQYLYTLPTFQFSRVTNTDHVEFFVVKDTAGLSYVLQTRSNLVNDVWQDSILPAVDTDAKWSVGLDAASAGPQGFFRLRSYVSPGTSPPWPP